MSVMERQPQQVAQVPVLHIVPALRSLEPQWQVTARHHLIRLMSSVLPSYSLRHRFRDYHAAESALLRRWGPEEIKERLRRAVLCTGHSPAAQPRSS